MSHSVRDLRLGLSTTIVSTTFNQFYTLLTIALSLLFLLPSVRAFSVNHFLVAFVPEQEHRTYSRWWPLSGGPLATSPWRYAFYGR